MKVAVVGCGSVGGIIAATLIRGGVDTTPVIRNPRLARAVAENGFNVLEVSGAKWCVRAPTIAATPGNAEQFDLIVMAVPNTALESALQDAAPALKPGGAFLLCQNGLPEDRARLIVGDNVLGCVVGWGANMTAPGMYRRTSPGGMQIGRLWPSAPDPNPVARVIAATAPSFAVADLAAVRWSKLAINCVTAAFGAIGGDTLGALMRYGAVRRLAMETFAETLAVAAASGIQPSPVRGTLKIQSVAISDSERRRWRLSILYKHFLMLAVGLKFRRMRSSMLYAIEQGREIEIDYLNGEVAARGKRLGVPTPANDAVIQTVRDVERGKARASAETLRNLARRIALC